LLRIAWELLSAAFARIRGQNPAEREKWMLKIGETILGDAPCVALALQDDASMDDVRDTVARGIGLIELRIDQFAFSDVERVRAEVARFEGLPVLATIRSRQEGGAWRGSEAERLALFKAVLPLVQAVDIELSAEEIRDEVIAAAHGAGVLVIGSHHNFDATPTLAELSGILLRGRDVGVDVVKVAAHCKGNADLRLLARFLVEQSGEPLIVLGMGPHGIASRLFFPALGSLVTYTFLGEATAPGQLNCECTLQYLSVVYPDFPRGQDAPQMKG
jgi:3-dehydroquinate dehydratase I